jgi:hypothetical protein
LIEIDDRTSDEPEGVSEAASQTRPQVIAASDESVLVVDAMCEQLAMERLRSVLQVKAIFVTTLDVDVEPGSPDEMSIAFSDCTRMVGAEVRRIDRVTEELAHELVITICLIAQRYGVPVGRLLQRWFECSDGDK